MSGPEHTPGPWSASEDKHSGHYDVSSVKEVIAQVLYVNNEAGGRGLADARLIAAAPELLEALDFMVNVSRSTPGFSPMAREQAERALAKARGEA